MVRFTPLAIVALAAPLVLAAPQPTAYDVELLDQPVHTSDSWAYVDCGNSDDVVHIESISVSPDPPQPGQNLTVTASGRVKTVIDEGAYADVVVKLGLIKLLQKRFDICEEARGANADIQCPVQPGQYTVSQTVELPKEIPRAKFTVDVHGYTANEESMICLNLKVNFMKNPWPRIW